MRRRAALRDVTEPARGDEPGARLAQLQQGVGCTRGAVKDPDHVAAGRPSRVEHLASATTMARAYSSPLEDTFVVCRRPSAWRKTMSVKIPPMSIAARQPGGCSAGVLVIALPHCLSPAIRVTMPRRWSTQRAATSPPGVSRRIAARARAAAAPGTRSCSPGSPSRATSPDRARSRSRWPRGRASEPSSSLSPRTSAASHGAGRPRSRPFAVSGSSCSRGLTRPDTTICSWRSAARPGWNRRSCRRRSTCTPRSASL